MGRIKTTTIRQSHKIHNGVYTPHKKRVAHSGDERILICNYCSGVNKLRHKHRTYMCEDCGKMYETFRRLPSSSPRYQQILRQYVDNSRKGYKVPAYDITLLKEVETMRICRQCGEEKEIEMFRKNAARGKGIYKTTQGHHTVCKECESINVRAIALEKIVDKKPKDQEMYELLTEYYRSLEASGLGVASAVAARYLGKEQESVATKETTSMEDKLRMQINKKRGDEVTILLNRLKVRDYSDPDEAGREIDRLKDKLKEAGKYDEADRMLEDWEQDFE